MKGQILSKPLINIELTKKSITFWIKGSWVRKAGQSANAPEIFECEFINEKGEKELTYFKAYMGTSHFVSVRMVQSQTFHYKVEYIIDKSYFVIREVWKPSEKQLPACRIFGDFVTEKTHRHNWTQSVHNVARKEKETVIAEGLLLYTDWATKQSIPAITDAHIHSDGNKMYRPIPESIPYYKNPELRTEENEFQDGKVTVSESGRVFPWSKGVIRLVLTNDIYKKEDPYYPELESEND